MKNLRFNNEFYNTDEITSIRIEFERAIVVRFNNGGSHSFHYPVDDNEDINEIFEKLMKDYNDAVEKRKNGLEVDTEGEKLRQTFEIIRRLEKERIENEAKLSDTVLLKKNLKQAQQQSLF